MAKRKSVLGWVISLLGRADRRRLAVVLAVSLIAALIDTVGVGSIAPFISVASKPEVIQHNPILHQIYQAGGFTSSEAFLWALGLAVVALLVSTSTFKALTRFVVVRFTSNARHHLTVKLMRGYLSQDYPFFLSRNTHEFVKNINAEVQTMVQGSLMTFVDMMGYIMQLSLLVTLLMFTSLVTTLVVAVSVGVVYGAIYLFTRKRLHRLGQNRYDLNRERSRIVSETFWGIKDVKVLGVEKSFLEQYEVPSAKLAKNESRAELAGDIPKFALEATAFASVVLFVLVMTIQSGGFQNAAATVGLFAFAAYRMIPSMQNLFKTLNKVRYSAAASQKISAEFALVGHHEADLSDKSERLPMEVGIEVKSLQYSYPASRQPVLRGLSFSVPKNRTLGIAGPTGSGKTTLVDILLGLLVVDDGSLKVDSVPISALNRRNWQANIGYVPQTIYLSNTSVARNIAFGVPPDQIDMDKVRRAAELAQIDEFVTTKLPNGYHTEVGERGTRLSGGQRQRVGIARALYRGPSVLVFDEATSALDHETEAALMDAVSALKGKMTMIMIAHRLSTLKTCHEILWLKDGEIEDRGTFEELKGRLASFQSQS